MRWVGDPSRFRDLASAVHGLNPQRLDDWPGGSPRGDADTKRGEDARIPDQRSLRAAPDEWKTQLRAVSLGMRGKKWSQRKGMPESVRSISVSKTLLASLAVDGHDEGIPGIVERTCRVNVVKAACEAKRNRPEIDSDRLKRGWRSTWPDHLGSGSPRISQRLSSPFRGGFSTDRQYTTSSRKTLTASSQSPARLMCTGVGTLGT